ncbi:MAG: polysaccharide deacetylase family protein [Gammaproteobacteria bacterium]|nr:polysaccharide deacetylase family protein [Gammaproteobacteria bacterium]
MTAWLDPVRQVLEQTQSPVQCFFRDDDAGWDDQGLFELLNLFRQYEVPIDLAVIPTSLSKNLIGRLMMRIYKQGQQIGLHQHGYSHTNHQIEGRKCEFGSSRHPEEQFSDIVIGQGILKESFNDYLQPIFTPPWNRCTQATVDVLESLGFSALSRDSSASPLQISQLREIPVHIDWFCKRKGVRVDFHGIGLQVAEHIQQHNTLGIMLHHQITNADERVVLAELLNLLSTHESIQLSLMKEISE